MTLDSPCWIMQTASLNANLVVFHDLIEMRRGGLPLNKTRTRKATRCTQESAHLCKSCSLHNPSLVYWYSFSVQLSQGQAWGSQGKRPVTKRQSMGAMQQSQHVTRGSQSKTAAISNALLYLSQELTTIQNFIRYICYNFIRYLKITPTVISNSCTG